MSETPNKEPSMLKALDEFWFGHGSPTALGMFRIMIGSLAFINLVMISLDWDGWFSESGYVPNWLGRLFGGGPMPIWTGSSFTIPRINILTDVLNPTLALAIYVLITLSALLTALGLWTRVSSVFLAIGIVSLHHRNQLILHGGDTVLRVMVLYLAISPCGRACSIDRLIRLWKGIDTGAPVRVSLWSQRLIMYNMALLYLTTTWIKRWGDLWMNGTATWYPARLNEFYKFPVPSFLVDLPMVKVTTWGTLLVEFALGTLVFYKPARKWVLLSGILLHAWIEYSMNIPLFAFLMVSMYVCFYEGTEIEAWARRVGERLKRFAVTVPLPAGMQLSQERIAFFRAADPFGLVTFTEGEKNALDPSAARLTWTRSAGAWIFGWIPGLWRGLLMRSLSPKA